MKTLELKDLKHYFDTGLKMMAAHPSRRRPMIEELTPDNLRAMLYLKRKPLMLPLSALTEPMEDESIPIVELAKKASIQDWDYDDIFIEGEYIVAQCGSSQRFIFDSKSFWFQNGYGNAEIAKNQLQLFEYLFANHFDVYGLIKYGLAIDKRTVL